MSRAPVLLRGATPLRVGFGSRCGQRSRRAAGVLRSASTRGAGAAERPAANRVVRHLDCVAVLEARTVLASTSVVASALNRAILLGGLSPSAVSTAPITSAA